VDTIDQVIKNAIEVMESSKYQIFEICESLHAEHQTLVNELNLIVEETRGMIDLVDKLELDFKRSRIRLTEVSRDFHRYKEADIRTAYEVATNLQLQLSISREKEIHLRARRDELQMRIKAAEKQIERAETIVSQMDVVLQYLSGDLNQVTRLLESAKNRQLLGLKIILAQEEERKRIAREIHDGLAQSLANVVLRSEIAERMLVRQDYPAVKQELFDLKGQVRDGLEEVRKIIFNLRPMALDDLGLVPTLRKFMQDYEDKTKIRTKFELQGIETRLPSGMEVAIFRLIQEAFSNVFKHASASYVSASMIFQNQMVKIAIQDNGVGFNVDSLEKKLSRNSHFGLVGMRERVELLEGRFEITSDSHNGTLITMLIPINQEPKEEE
jgi:two-component system sensor histidine kinase DegS